MLSSVFIKYLAATFFHSGYSSLHSHIYVLGFSFLHIFYIPKMYELEHIMLSETNQTQKAMYCCFDLHERSRIGKSIESEGKVVVARGWRRRGSGQSLRMDARFPFGVMN